ncbi:MAG: hypothetical protein COA79_23275 [Planctomycetota bacterium]|nr:MAG: hypothetical protein COA79_23275 [Planctomycetota bacterium]
MKIYFLLILLITSKICFSEELIIGIGDSYSEPLIIKKGGKIKDGIIFDFVTYIGREMNWNIKFKNTPRKRVEEFLSKGEIHICPRLNRKWLKQHKRYNWSIPWMEENIIILGRHKVKTYEKLNGIIGTIRGFNYPLKLSELFKNKTLKRQDSLNYKTAFDMLTLNRVDYIVIPEYIANYYMKKSSKKFQNCFSIKKATLHVVVSKHANISMPKLNKAIEKFKINQNLKKK